MYNLQDAIQNVTAQADAEAAIAQLCWNEGDKAGFNKHQKESDDRFLAVENAENSGHIEDLANYISVQSYC